MRRNYTLSMDTEIVRRAREISAPIPFSRFAEHLLKVEIERHDQKLGSEAENSKTQSSAKDAIDELLERLTRESDNS